MTKEKSKAVQAVGSAGLRKILKIVFGIGAILAVLFLAGYIQEFFSRTGPVVSPLSDDLQPPVSSTPASAGSGAVRPSLQPAAPVSADPFFDKNRRETQQPFREPPGPGSAQPGLSVEDAPGRASAAPEDAPVVYTVQLGSFQISESARNFSENLAAKGYEPYIIRVALPGKGTVYRVRMGRFEDMQAAKELAAEIEKREKLTALITSR